MLNRLAKYIVNLFIPYLQSALEPVLDDLIDQAADGIARKVQHLIDREVNDFDATDAVNEAMKNINIDREVEQAIEEADIERQVTDAIDEADIEDLVEQAIEEEIENLSLTRHAKEKLNTAVREELKKIFAESLV